MSRFSLESRSCVAPPLLGLSSFQPLESCSFPRLLGRVCVCTAGLRRGRLSPLLLACLENQQAFSCAATATSHSGHFPFSPQFFPPLPTSWLKIGLLELQAGERPRAAAQASDYTARAFTHHCAVDSGVTEQLRSWVAKIGGPGSHRRPLLSYWVLLGLNGQARGALYGPKAEWGLDPYWQCL